MTKFIYLNCRAFRPHSIFDSLELFLSWLTPNGRAFITTPNLLRFSNRSAKSYGHITLYAIDRFKLLLHDSWFEILESFTINYGFPPYPLGHFYKPLILTFCSFLSYWVLYSKDLIEICAIVICNEYSKYFYRFILLVKIFPYNLW